jgi:hypothetical protein
MIWESHFWKDDLLKKAAKLRKAKTKERWSEADLARLEQTLMLGFYAVRKLHEAAKLSTAVMKHRIPLLSFPWSGKQVTRWNWHKFDQLYVFESGATQERDFGFVCNQIIHSFVFIASFDEEGRLHAILFTSDHQRHESLFQAGIDQIADLFDLVGRDYPNHGRYIRDPKTGDEDVLAEMHDSDTRTDDLTDSSS